MTTFDAVPEPRREAAHAAFAAVFGAAPVTALQPVLGGASSALAFRAEVAGRAYLLRLEGPRAPMRNPHQYTCMRIAADAGIAPRLHHVDDAAGAVVMDFIAARPLEEYPGGAPALACDAGRLIARLQATPQFPQLMDYRAILARMLAYMRSGALYAPGLLDRHADGFERIRAVYPWDASTHVSSHNDPNPRNILFDGTRLWLIDWETSYRNDPLVDVAIVAGQFALAPAQEDALLQAWLGRAPDRSLRAKLTLMHLLTRLYYAGLFAVTVPPGTAPETDLSAPTPDEFRAAVESGRVRPGMPETTRLLAKVVLAQFTAGLDALGFEEALAIAGGGG